MYRTWEEVNHELEDSVAGALMSPVGPKGEGEGDPLGFGSNLRYVALPCLFQHVVTKVGPKTWKWNSASSSLFLARVTLLMVAQRPPV